MPQELETMYVDRKGVKVWINKSDFNSAIEKPWEDAPQKAVIPRVKAKPGPKPKGKTE